jgi:hypothetical protein
MGFKARHQRLSREYNNRSETSTENLREVYYYQANPPEHLEVQPEEEVDEDENCPSILKCEVEKLSR